MTMRHLDFVEAPTFTNFRFNLNVKIFIENIRP